MNIRPQIIFLTGAFTLAAPSALAMNWEGHDEWVHLPAMAEESGLTAPEPAAKPLPPCSRREAESKLNIYAQIPLSGLNCREDRKSKR